MAADDPDGALIGEAAVDEGDLPEGAGAGEFMAAKVTGDDIGTSVEVPGAVWAPR